MKALYQSVSDIWKISFEDFTEVLSSDVVFAEHGKKKTSAKASFGQIEATFGELLLCKPLIVQINSIAANHTELYAWNPQDLIIKVLQKTTRKFKLQTILETVTGIDAIKDDLFIAFYRRQITEEAFDSIRKHLQILLGAAVSGKSKEQLRQLKSLLAVLGGEPSLICTGYEEDIEGPAPVDMLLQWMDQPPDAPGIVIEIEGMPNSKAPDAYEYLKERYEEKVKTVGVFAEKLGHELFLMLPAGTVIPSSEWEKINTDKDLLVWQPSGPEQESEEPSKPLLEDSEVRKVKSLIVQFQRAALKELSSGKKVGAMRLRIYQMFVNLVENHVLGKLNEDGAQAYFGQMYFPEMTLKGAYLDEPDEETEKIPPLDLAKQDLNRVVLALLKFLGG